MANFDDFIGLYVIGYLENQINGQLHLQNNRHTFCSAFQMFDSLKIIDLIKAWQRNLLTN